MGVIELKGEEKDLKVNGVSCAETFFHERNGNVGVMIEELEMCDPVA